MPCLFALFAGMFPRIADIFIWIARPTQFMNSFNDKWWWAILGIIFLPFTTLMYVILTWGVGGLMAGIGSGSSWPCSLTFRTMPILPITTAVPSLVTPLQPAKENFKKALERQPDDIKVVIQFSDV